MAKERRSFTPEERLSIVQEGLDGQRSKYKRVNTAIRELQEGNAYIEVYRSLFEREVVRQFEFSSY